MENKKINIESLNINAPFKTPSGYFDKMEHQILAEIQLSQYLKNVNDQLPEYYFENLEQKILTQTVDKDKSDTKTPTWKTYRNYFATAASVVIVSLLTYFSRQGAPVPALQEIPSEYIMAYLNDQAIDEDEIIQYVADKKLLCQHY